MNGDQQYLKAGNIFEIGRRGGEGQDKQPPWRLRSASPEPPTFSSSTQTAPLGSATATPQAVGNKGGSATAAIAAVDSPTHHGSETRRTEQITGRVPRHVKSEVSRIGKLHGWKESYTVNILVQQALAQNLAEQFGVKLAGVVTDAMEKGWRKYSNRQAYFSVQGYKAAEESRIINTKVLRYLFGEETAIYQQIVRDAREEVRDKLNKQSEVK